MKKQIHHEIELFHIAGDTTPTVPIVTSVNVHAGFPCPIDDAYMSQPIDLNKELIVHPATSFIVRVVGDSMVDEGIDQGDLLVVDRSLFPTEKKICVVMYEEEFALKRVVQHGDSIMLMPGNRNYDPIEVTSPERLTVWGVVTWVMKKK